MNIVGELINDKSLVQKFGTPHILLLLLWLTDILWCIELSALLQENKLSPSNDWENLSENEKKVLTTPGSNSLPCRSSNPEHWFRSPDTVKTAQKQRLDQLGEKEDLYLLVWKLVAVRACVSSRHLIITLLLSSIKYAAAHLRWWDVDTLGLLPICCWSATHLRCCRCRGRDGRQTEPFASLLLFSFGLWVVSRSTSVVWSTPFLRSLRVVQTAPAQGSSV